MERLVFSPQTKILSEKRDFLEGRPISHTELPNGICISFGLCVRWMFTNGASEVADLLRRWLVGELAVGV